jgi:hypothetical protein
LGGCAFIPVAIIIIASLYAYRVNARKAPDDPLKKDYSPYAPWITPISLPLFLIFNTIFFVFSAMAFGVFLVLFPFALILFRGPIIFKWIREQALKIGNFMLKVNTKLLRMAGFHSISTGYSA